MNFRPMLREGGCHELGDCQAPFRRGCDSCRNFDTQRRDGKGVLPCNRFLTILVKSASYAWGRARVGQDSKSGPALADMRSGSGYGQASTARIHVASVINKFAWAEVSSFLAACAMVRLMKSFRLEQAVEMSPFVRAFCAALRATLRNWHLKIPQNPQRPARRPLQGRDAPWMLRTMEFILSLCHVDVPAWRRRC